MNVLTSQVTRTLLIRLSRGESLIESLVGVARENDIWAATITGHGALQSVTIEGYDPRVKAYVDRKAFAGSMELLTLSGHMLHNPADSLVQLHVTVSRQTDNGLQVLGGRVLDAQAIAVDLTVLVHDDVKMVMQIDTATGLPSWRGESRSGAAPTAPARALTPPPTVAAREPSREPIRETVRTAPAPMPAVTTVRSLGDVARELEAMPAKYTRDDPGESGDIQPGDLLEHPAWRLCEVLREAEPGTFDIRIVERGTTRTIKVDIFEVTPKPPRDGKRVWQLKPRAK